jgi:hypothetical protein
MSTSTNPAVISRPAFFPLAVGLLVVGHVLDLAGTYRAQPNFEFEANWLYRLLLSWGIYLGWPGAILGKALSALLMAAALQAALRHRRSFYPAAQGTFGEFLTSFFLGRPLPWAETAYRGRCPRHWLAAMVVVGLTVGVSGPYFAYLGYSNVAATYGWWRAPGFWVGGAWIELPLVLYALLAPAWAVHQLWLDYREPL